MSFEWHNQGTPKRKKRTGQENYFCLNCKYTFVYGSTLFTSGAAFGTVLRTELHFYIGVSFLTKQYVSTSWVILNKTTPDTTFNNKITYPSVNHDVVKFIVSVRILYTVCFLGRPCRIAIGGINHGRDTDNKMIGSFGILILFSHCDQVSTLHVVCERVKILPIHDISDRTTVVRKKGLLCHHYEQTERLKLLRNYARPTLKFKGLLDMRLI